MAVKGAGIMPAAIVTTEIEETIVEKLRKLPLRNSGKLRIL